MVMSQVRLRRAFGMALFLAAIAWAVSPPASAQVQYQFQILHSFGSPGDGAGPDGGLVFDQEGDLYGVTATDSAGGFGKVFELTPGADGQWTETILHSFSGGTTDGYDPAGVAIDKSGNLYGTTTYGGLNDLGTIFELSPAGGGQWNETILWNCSSADCALPLFPPTLGPKSILYGITTRSVYSLAQGSNGWAFSVLYAFCSLPNCADGSDALGSPTFDAKANLYGVTQDGGTGGGINCSLGCGVVFVLHPEPTFPWKETVLYDFQYPDSGVTGGATLRGGKLYGTTGGGGGGCECGTVYELAQGSGGSIEEQVIHGFTTGSQGITPWRAVEFDPLGDLFGVTLYGGNLDFCGVGCGAVYGMKQERNGNWGFAVLHDFTYSDGEEPDAPLTVDTKGNLFGITTAGGPYQGGVVFELSPTAQASK